jgi:hypothetical protein
VVDSIVRWSATRENCDSDEGGTFLARNLVCSVQETHFDFPESPVI